MATDLTQQTLVGDVLGMWPQTARVFTGRGMGCVGCVMARFVTLAEVAAAYGLMNQELLDELSRVVENGRSR